MFETETDVLPGQGTSLEFSRTYNSLDRYGAPRQGLTGIKWMSTFDRRLTLQQSWSATSLYVERPGGDAHFFTLTNGVWQPDSDVNETIVQTPGGWMYTSRDGTNETYDTSGRLLAITDPHGLTETLGYDVAGRLATVADPFGHALSFAYDTSNRLSTLTTPDGFTIAYSYDAAGNLIRVAYPDGSAKVYLYENPSHPNMVTGTSLDNGTGTLTRLSTHAYDALGKVVSAERAGGVEKFVFSYDSGSQASATDAAGNKEVMTFATHLGVRNLVSNTNLSDNKTLRQTFNANNNRTCRQDEEGRVTSWTYNATNQKTAMTEGQGGSCSAPVPTSATRTTTYQYLSPTLDLPTQIQSPSVYAGSLKTVSISYSGNLPTTITQSGFTPSGAAVSRSVTLGYNASGQVSSIDGPRTDVNDVTTLTYYNCTTGGGCGQLSSVTNALGQTTIYDSYDAAGRLLQTTDPNGLKTVYTYDTRGRVASINQGGRVTSYSYDALGNVASVSLPTGLSLTYTYNAANYLTQVVDSLGNHVAYSYDLKGNRTQVYTYDPSGTLVRAIDTAYDARNRVSQINTGGSITKQLWDAIGNLTAVTDPNTVAANGTAATTSSYDSLNRLFKTVDLLNGNTSYAYDVNDRAKTVQAPNGATTQYQYDDLGNLLSETSPDRGALTYTYDVAGNVRSQTDARGITVNYGYDALNRLTSVMYPDPAENVTYVYDGGANCSFGIGRLCSVQDAAASEQYAYDAFGNVVTDTRTELNVIYTTSYAYDAGNRVTSITYPDGRVVSYTRDAKGEIQTVALNEQGTVTTLISGSTYRPDGLLLTRTFGNGLVDTRAYDTQGRLVNGFLGSLDTRVYGYDANGNLTSLQSLPQVGAYQFDALNRLNREDLTTQATTTTTWTYDGNGNRLTQNTGAYSYTGYTNRLTNDPAGSLTLDASGNTTSDESGVRSYNYFQAGTLSQVMVSGGVAGTYSYDAQNRRTRKVTPTGITVFHYDLQGNLLAETDDSGNLIRDYVWVDSMPVAQITMVPAATDPRTLPGANGNVQGQGQGQVNGQGSANVAAHRPALPATAQRPGATGTAGSTSSTEVLVYLGTDGLGTPRVATDTQGQVVWRWDGTAFSETAPNEDPSGAGTTTVVNLRFSGQYYDAETGLYYNWNRYYDPKTGRYIASDPMGIVEHVQKWKTTLGKGIDSPPLELNSYSYVSSNPLQWVDPTGLKTLVCSKYWHPHTFLCVDGTCSGKYPSGNPLISPGDIRDDSPNQSKASCSAVPNKCPGNSFDECVKKRLLQRGPSVDYYNFTGANCGAWVEEVIESCRNQCSQSK